MDKLFHSEGQQLKHFLVLFMKSLKTEAVQFRVVQPWAGTEKLAQHWLCIIPDHIVCCI